MQTTDPEGSKPISPPPLSVCVPTFNGEEYLAEAVQSILSQSFTDFELLIVDDRSTDSTWDIIRSFSDPRLSSYRNKERLGLSANWNRCLSLARGEYFCLFHQDDVMFPDNLARKVAVLDEHPTVSLAHSAIEFIVESSAPTIPAEWVETHSEDFIAEGRQYFYKLQFQGTCICAPAVVTRRETLVALGGFDEELGCACDYEMWLKLCVEGGVAFLSQPLVRYRWHGKNTSHEYRFENGVEELLTASRRGEEYYLQRTGRREEAEILEEARKSLAGLRRWAIALDRGRIWIEEQWKGSRQLITEQRAWIGKLEQSLQQELSRRKALEREKARLEEQLPGYQESAEP